MVKTSMDLGGAPDLSAGRKFSSGTVSFMVTEVGGHLSDVAFTLPNDRTVRPMHAAPWRGERFSDDIPPMLRQLSGDFFCAPFGPADLPGHETAPHGGTANGHWCLTDQNDDGLTFVLDEKVMGATVTKTISSAPDETVIYHRHSFSGGDGALPMGHHAMLSARAPLKLSFGPSVWAGSAPVPTETPPDGRSLLAVGRKFDDVRAAPLASGETVDLTRYPFAHGHEDIWMLVANRDVALGWTTAYCEAEGWIWFSLKNTRQLPQTVVWMSNGGRSYPPWNDRHRLAIGLEEVCAYFHLGHTASLEQSGKDDIFGPTVVRLTPSSPHVISYIFGVAPAPRDFGAVADIEPTSDGVALIGANGHRVFAPCNLGFLNGGP